MSDDAWVALPPCATTMAGTRLRALSASCFTVIAQRGIDKGLATDGVRG